VRNNLLPIDTEICVLVKGGKLFITCKTDYTMIMRGNAVETFRGIYNLC